MKKIEITAEWILENFPVSTYADGLGNVTIHTVNISDSNWIELALESMDIFYETYDTEDWENEIFEIFYEFRLESIKDDCPNLYKEWLIMDMRNSAFKRRN